MANRFTATKPRLHMPRVLPTPNSNSTSPCPPCLGHDKTQLRSLIRDAKVKGATDHYYWFHGTMAMVQMGGKYWDLWSRAAGAAMLSTQRRDGSTKGSWNSSGAWGEDGGRIYATALTLIALQATWRKAKLIR